MLSPTFSSLSQHNISFDRHRLGLTWLSISICLSIVTIFLPANPWRRLTSTLAYDVIRAFCGVLIQTSFPRQSHCSQDLPILGNHPLGTLKYNPADDPYYISNLNLPVDDFVASALKDAQFTNIVHIVLESMREDSFPYDEHGLLHQHIQNNMTLVQGGTPVNTRTVTPFIDSLAEHTLSWHTMWSTIPYTHKTMLGCTFQYGVINTSLVWHASTSGGLDPGVCFPRQKLSTLFPTSSSTYEFSYRY